MGCRPTLSFDNDGRKLFFEPDLEELKDLQCPEILKTLGNLLAGESKVCIYAAELQNQRTEDKSFWILEKIKTRKGYWIVPEHRQTDEQDSDDSEGIVESD